MAVIETRLVDANALRHFSEAVLRTLGMTEEQARLCTDGMMHGEARNLPGQGQGFRKLPTYRTRIQGGEMDIHAPLTIIREGPVITLLDANNGCGVVAGVKAMERAIGRAEMMGVGIVGVRGSTHFGTAAHHAMLALPHDMIGIAMSNAGPEMAPWGGYTGVVGTNPWSVAIPAGEEYPVVLDMANTTAGKGMMRWLMREGKTMPRDWALTPDGEETDDPAAAMDGALLPAGGPKGYGIAVVVDALAGVLTGAAFATACYADPNRLNVGHQFIALQIEQFMPVGEFRTRMDAFIREIKAAPRRRGVEAIYLPGEREFRRSAEKERHGIPLDLAVYTELEMLARDLDVPLAIDRVKLTA
jgi:LDH2 family malate/lactate/ureidoglycolate dehydrogenase